MSENISHLKQDVIDIGRLLWDKDLASGLNGNVSARFDEKTVVITAHATSLGYLNEGDVLELNLANSELLEDGQVSTEKLLHTEIYKAYPVVQCVVHTHTTYTNAYFLNNQTLNPKIFETKMILGSISAVVQNTPAVTDAKPVIEALKNNNIAVLKNHGVVAMGETLFDCFVLIQALEEACKIDYISRQYTSKNENFESEEQKKTTDKKYKLFSQEQIDEIVKYVNEDDQLKSLGEQTNMTMDLAIKMQESDQTYQFKFIKGRIDKVTSSEDAEFLITAPESVWRSVFNQEIDPFVATTQKKMHLKGDFAKISKWYAPCSRVFELWQKVPIE